MADNELCVIRLWFIKPSSLPDQTFGTDFGLGTDNHGLYISKHKAMSMIYGWARIML